MIPAGSYETVVVDEDSGPLYLVQFDKTGRVLNPRTADKLLDEVRSGAFTDLYLLSHGWNNEFADALALYREFFAGYLGQRRRAGSAADHRPLFVGTVWPSTALVLPWDEPPKMAGADTMSDHERAVLALGEAIPPDDRAEFERLAGAKELDQAAARKLAAMLVAVFRDGESSDIQAELPATDGNSGMTAGDVVRLWSVVSERGPSVSARRDGRATFATDEDEDEDPAQPAAAFSLAVLDPRNIVRLATVRLMKDRAGTVGAFGLGPLLGKWLNESAEAMRIHLLGHSYGAKVVLSAARHAPPTGKKIASMLLLQPAVSCFCFANNVFGEPVEGGYRPVLDRVSQPVLVTFSSRDLPLSWFFHLAVRRAADLAEQRTAATVPSRFAALGGYGPQGVDGETETVPIDDVLDTANNDILPRRPGRNWKASTKVAGVNGTARINGHGDVRNPAVQALLATLATRASV